LRIGKVPFPGGNHFRVNPLPSLLKLLKEALKSFFFSLMDYPPYILGQGFPVPLSHLGQALPHFVQEATLKVSFGKYLLLDPILADPQGSVDHFFSHSEGTPWGLYLLSRRALRVGEMSLGGEVTCIHGIGSFSNLSSFPMVSRTSLILSRISFATSLCNRALTSSLLPPNSLRSFWYLVHYERKSADVLPPPARNVATKQSQHFKGETAPETKIRPRSDFFVGHCEGFFSVTARSEATKRSRIFQ